MHYLLSFFLFIGIYTSESFSSANDDIIQSVANNHDNDLDSPGRTIRVLSIQGGGIRGIIPAKILQAAEEELGDSIMNYFDVFAGTSTGSLISLGLVAPSEELHLPLYKAEDIVNIYRKHGSDIFSRKASDKFFNPYAVCKPKYSPDNLKNILKTYFKDIYLSNALKTVLVTSYDLQNSQPVTFNSFQAQQSEEFNFSMRKVARASSAAPAFFPPAHLKMWDNTKITLSDGCIWALNPAEVAYREAKKLYPDARIQVVSLGTGKHKLSLSHLDAKKMGSLGWASHLPFFSISAQADLVETHLREDLPESDYLRLNIDLDRGKRDMDDVSSENIKYLELKAQEIIDGPDFATLINMLTS